MTRALVALALAGVPALAVAHPLGNFTVNRWTAVRIAPGTVAVRYVVDLAEIPTFQEMRRLDADGDGTIDAGERDVYVARMGGELGPNLVLTVDGQPLALVAGAGTLELPPGAGGLPTLRLEIPFGTALAPGRGVVELRDRNFAGRPGWQEMIADAGDGIALTG